jgi:hypothetical protein
MILKKLQEALAAVESERKSLDETEKQLRAMIGRHSSKEEVDVFDLFEQEEERPPAPRRVARKRRKHDKLDDYVQILRDVGHPLHIVELAGRYSSKIGKPFKRTDIEPGINRHISKTKAPRIAKIAPSTFGLPEWKQPTLAKTA